MNINLDEADIPVLLMVLVHLTGDLDWLADRYQPERTGRLFAEESGGLPEEVQEEVRAAVREAIARGAEPRQLPDSTVQRMMSHMIGEEVPAEYLPLMMRELGYTSPPPTASARPDGAPTVCLIGAGISGLALGMKLEKMGIKYVILEKNSSIGGTWYENRYPEAGVDTPNHFYSFRDMPNSEWSSYFSKAPEILSYLQDCAKRTGVDQRIILDADVSHASYDEERRQWTVEYSTGEGQTVSLTTDVLVSAVGQVNRPKLPDLVGVNAFEGRIVHTAQWPADLALRDKRVVLVGTGASAVQAARSIAAEASELTIVQRSPQWIMPNPDYHRAVSESKRTLIRDVPFYATWYRFGLFWRYADGVHPSLVVDPEWNSEGRSINETNDRHRGFLTRYLEDRVGDRPDLLTKVLPDYPPYGKRMVVDNDWFKTLKRENVSLECGELAGFRASSVLLTDGRRIAADVVILATGFNATTMLWPLELCGRGGVSIHDYWQRDEPITHLGITTPKFPNFFMLLGPSTSLAHGGSVIFQVEAQVEYIAQWLSLMIERNLGEVEVREEAALRYTAEVDEAHSQLVFSHPGMNNWYKNRRGRVVTVSPWRLIDYWQRTQEIATEDFSLVPRSEFPAGTTAI